MIVFVHIEKTAGTSLKFIFRNTFGIRHCDSRKNKKVIFKQHDLELAKKIFGKIRCISGHNLVEPTKNLTEPGLFLLTMLRDPIKRSASYYQDDCIRGKYNGGFENWIADKSKHNMQVKKIAGEENWEKAIELLSNDYHFVGLTERFNESLKLLSLLCPYKLNLKFKKKLIAQDNSIKNGLMNDAGTRQMLREANNHDLKLYEYVKKELFPKNLATHKDKLEQVNLPDSFYKTHLTFNYQTSIGLNKFIYRQWLKIIKETG